MDAWEVAQKALGVDDLDMLAADVALTTCFNEPNILTIALVRRSGRIGATWVVVGLDEAQYERDGARAVGRLFRRHLERIRRQL